MTEKTYSKEDVDTLLKEREKELLERLGLHTPEAVQEMRDAMELARRVNKTTGIVGGVILRKAVGIFAIIFIGQVLAKYGISIPQWLIK